MLNLDCARWTDELAQLTSDAADTAILVAHQRGRAAVVVWHLGIKGLLRVLHCHFGPTKQHVFEMLQGNGHSANDCRQVKPLGPTHFRSWNSDGHDRSRINKRRKRRIRKEKAIALHSSVSVFLIHPKRWLS